MTKVAFIGTFDPLHGAHIGQLLRAHQYAAFDEAYILIDKNPAHKPNASAWEHRLNMARLALASFELPFNYELLAAEDSRADELTVGIDYKVTGKDSLVENLQDKSRWDLAQRWPMIVLSIPGEDDSDLLDAVSALPDDVQPTIRYEYVSEDDVPILNYDFDTRSFVTRRIHATYLRSGRENSLIPPTVRDYIVEHGLYEADAQAV